MGKIKRNLNYKIKGPQAGDVRFKSIMRKEEPLPPEVDLRSTGFLADVYDQGQEGSCTAHAAAGHKHYLSSMCKVDEVPSRQMIYYCERVADGDPGEDGGSSLKQSCDVLLKVGVCAEKLWPYTENDMYKNPGKKEYADAAKHKIGSYYYLAGSKEYKRCLANGYPFVFGIVVPRELMSENFSNYLDLPLHDDGDGGHALLCVGYKMINNKLYYIIRNSWGASWGDAGYFYISADVFEDTDWVSDCYTMRLARQPGM